MTIHPDRLRRIREHHDRALTVLNLNQYPTTAEFLAVVHDMTDMLNDYTTTHRSKP